MPNTVPSVRLRWHTVLVALLTVGLLWWFFRTINLAEVGAAIRQARKLDIVLAVVITLQTYLLRAWRWQTLLAPIGRARYRVAFRTTVIGFTATFLLPGRIGEILRPYLLARAEGFNPAATFATIIIERLLDLVAVLVLFAFFLATTSIEVSEDVKVGGIIGGVLGVVGIAGMTLLAGHPERVGRWAGRVLRVLPGRLGEKAGGIVHRFAEGLGVMRRPGPLLAASVVSLVLWVSIAIGVWLTSRAFQIHFPLTGTFLVLMFLVVGVAVPTPAGVGAFHWAYRVAVVTFFGAAEADASAAAIVLHAVSFVPVSLLGLVFMAQDGLTLAGLRNMRSTAEAAERTGSDVARPRIEETP